MIIVKTCNKHGEFNFPFLRKIQLRNPQLTAIIFPLKQILSMYKILIEIESRV